MSPKRSLAMCRRAFVALLGGLLCAVPSHAQKTDDALPKEGFDDPGVEDITLGAEQLYRAAVARRKKREQLASTVKQCIERLLTVEDYTTLESLPRTWRRTLSAEVQRELVAQLFGYIPSKRPLSLQLPDNVVIRDAQPSRTKPADSEHIVLIAENILTEGGRAEWAIRELLLVTTTFTHGNALEWSLVPSPPRVTGAPASLVVLARDVIRAMTMPVWSRLETLTVAERVRLALSPDADPRLLRELATAPEAEVRLAVAKNVRASLKTVARLAQDADPNVRRIAKKNLTYSRVLFSPPIGE